MALADLALTEGPAYTAADTTSALMGGAVYMAVMRDQNNTELWRSDGTPGGATLVKSIPAFQSSTAGAPPALANFTVVGSTLFFTVDGSELWKSDGTAAGTVELSNVITGRTNFFTPEFVSVGGRLYFTANNSSSSTVTELWTSDGTDVGTRRINLFDGSYSGVSQLVPDGNTLYFVSGGVGIYKLTAGSTSAPVKFASNGVMAGRSMAVMNGALYFIGRDSSSFVYKLFRYPGSGTPTSWGSFTDYSRNPYLTVMGGKLYFGASAYNDQTLQELWQSDGTAAGTRLLKDIHPTYHSDPSQLTAVGDLLYFTADDGTHGSELWRTDGTADGTFLVTDLVPGKNDGWPRQLVDVGGRLFFTGHTLDGGGELWRSDGTEETTVQVADLYAGTGSSSPHELIADGDKLYFQAVDSRTGYGLFSVGRDGGDVTLLKDYLAGPMNGKVDRAVMADGRFVFSAGDGTATGRELYLSDGTPAGTGLLKNIYTTSWFSSSPSSLTRMGDSVYFSASSNFQVGAELWKTDGTAAGTVLVKDIRPNTYSDRGSSPKSLVEVNGALYFVADDGGGQGPRLYRSDGTDAGTSVITGDVDPLSGNFTPFNWGGVLYFFYNSNTLMKYDGTGPYATTVRTITPAQGGSSSSTRFQSFGIANGLLWMGGNDGVSGLELWKSDGTTDGTGLLKEINTNTDFTKGTTSSSPAGFVGLGGYVYFSATELAHGSELWRTDGTAAGTTLFKDIAPGTGYGTPGNLLRLGDTLLFTAYSQGLNRTLWRTDGTPEGTVLVKDLGATGSTSVSDFTVIGDEVWFTVVDAATGVRQLWVTDGTTAGTVRASEVIPGFTAANPMNLTAVGNALYLTANDGVSGPRLYRIDGDVLPANVIRGAFEPAGPKSAVSLAFTADVGAPIAAADLDLRNTATGERVDPAIYRIDYDAARRRATVTFTGVGLPDGNYRLTVPATAIRDTDGRAMSADFSMDFFTLAGDATRDRVVNFDDLLILAKNYNKTGATFAQGDFTGDGVVNFDDLLVLAKNYNKTLPATGAAPAPGMMMDVQALAAAMGIAAPTAPTITPQPSAPAKRPPAALPKPAPRPTPPTKPVSTIVARPGASVVRDEEKSKPVFSRTPVGKPAPAPAKAKPKSR